MVFVELLSECQRLLRVLRPFKATLKNLNAEMGAVILQNSPIFFILLNMFKSAQCPGWRINSTHVAQAPERGEVLIPWWTSLPS